MPRNPAVTADQTFAPMTFPPVIERPEVCQQYATNASRPRKRSGGAAAQESAG